MLALGEETAVQVVVGSIAWAFRRLKKPRRIRETSARGYALHSVRRHISFRTAAIDRPSGVRDEGWHLVAANDKGGSRQHLRAA